jgi:L1 cell adhesion molecule like protein
MQAAEDFFELVLEAHIVAAAKKEYNPEHSVTTLAKNIVEKYVRLGFGSLPSDDQVHIYACEVVTLGLIWLNYYDAIKEGDGERILKLWKYLMIIFNKCGRRNYAKEAALLLIQFHYTSSERVASQLMTGRFVNTKGRAGCNLPCDLHMEHLNRRLSGIINHLGSNVQPATITRAAKAVGVVDHICRIFSESLRGKIDSDRHPKPTTLKDFNVIIKELMDNDVFSKQQSRKHVNVKCLHNTLFESVNIDKIKLWLKTKILPTVLYS